MFDSCTAMRRFIRLCCSLALLASLALAQPVVTWSGESMRLQSAAVTALPTGWRLTLTMGNDNGNSALGSSFRRWWHCEVGGLDPALTQSIEVRIANAGYTDIILPVWATSTNGVTFGGYARLPVSAVPVYQSSQHVFTFTKPVGVSAIRLAKYFPWTVSAKNAWLAGLAGHPSGHVRAINILGTSIQGRSIELVELTNTAIPDIGKTRVWIHSGIHPAESTSYFAVEGLVSFLLSGDPRAEALLAQTILDIVPMANPDGVHLGNYRTNAASSNLENEWAAPYNSVQPEIIALRSRIESFMGTSATPGANPVRALLNLHSSHNVAYPFHFQHSANPSFNLSTNNSGVVPAVNAMEGQWIGALRARSSFVNLGTTQTSSAGAPTRPFVESMMHDRWSINPLWTGAPNFLEQVMAITLEGTYGYGPVSGVWNVPDDYRTMGAGIALALGDFLGVLPALSVTTFGIPCAGGTQLTGTFTALASGAQLDLIASAAPPGWPAWLVVSPYTTNLPLPSTNCPLLVSPDLLIPAALNAAGGWSLSVFIPSGLNMDLYAQFVAAAPLAQGWSFEPSAALRVVSLW